MRYACMPCCAAQHLENPNCTSTIPAGAQPLRPSTSTTARPCRREGGEHTRMPCMALVIVSASGTGGLAQYRSWLRPISSAPAAQTASPVGMHEAQHRPDYSRQARKWHSPRPCALHPASAQHLLHRQVLPWVHTVRHTLGHSAPQPLTLAPYIPSSPKRCWYLPFHQHLLPSSQLLDWGTTALQTITRIVDVHRQTTLTNMHITAHCQHTPL
jgi:hypothetical protein